MTSSRTAALVLRADELRPGLEPLDVGPGIIGFLVIFALVLACIPLFRSLTGKVRGLEHRALPEEPDSGTPDGVASGAEASRDGGSDSAGSDSAGPRSVGSDGGERGDEDDPGGTGR
jgi:hypothetical protein